MQTYNRIALVATFLAATGLAACGGGGGGGALPPAGGGPGPLPTGTPVVVVTPTPTPKPSTGAPTPAPTATPVTAPTPTPVPTATPASATASVSGRVTDDSGAPVAGATVYAGPNLPKGATPTSSGALATTAADGSFTVSGIANANTGLEYNASPSGSDFNATWIVVWSKDAALPVYHGSRTLANPTGANALGSIVLHRLSPADLNAIATINAYRATQGSGPLAVDEIAVEAANLWAAYVAVHPGVDHACPSSDTACVSAQRYENAHGERGAAENIGPNPDWNADIGENESEAANCQPQPAQYASCSAYAQSSPSAFASVGHWLNLVDPSATWIGVGTAPYSPGYLEFDIETSTL